MTQDEVVDIVMSCNAGFKESTRQRQYNQVRFYGAARASSINIGFSEPEGAFIADFVFIGGPPDVNASRASAFIRLFGGERGRRATQFVRVKVPFIETPRLKHLVHAYAALAPASSA